MSDDTSNTAPTFLRLPTVIAKVGLKKTAIYELIKEGLFPRPCKQGNTSLWVEQEISDWQRCRMNERQAA